MGILRTLFGGKRRKPDSVQNPECSALVLFANALLSIYSYKRKITYQALSRNMGLGKAEIEHLLDEATAIVQGEREVADAGNDAIHAYLFDESLLHAEQASLGKSIYHSVAVSKAKECGGLRISIIKMVDGNPADELRCFLHVVEGEPSFMFEGDVKDGSIVLSKSESNQLVVKKAR